MAASDMHTASAAVRRRLLTNLLTSPESETYIACKDAKTLEETVQAGIHDLTYSSFGSVNPKHVAAHASAVSNLLSRHAQTGKLEAFEKLKSKYAFTHNVLCPCQAAQVQKHIPDQL